MYLFMFLSLKDPVILIVKPDHEASGATYQQTNFLLPESFPSKRACIPQKIKSSSTLNKKVRGFWEKVSTLDSQGSLDCTSG
jgi:hypothetical protein